VLSIAIPLISLPEQEREELEKLPPQLAKLVKKKPEVKKAPKADKKVDEKLKDPAKEKKLEPKEPPKTPELKPKAEPKVEPKPKPKKNTQLIKEAKEVAQKSGLLALQSELAEMQESVDMSALSSVKPLPVQKTIAAKANAINSNTVYSKSQGIKTSQTGPRESVALSRNDTMQLTETADEIALALAEAEAQKGERLRSDESIRLTIEKLKASFYKLYNRELRKDPFLEGRLVLEVVIEATGEVSYCRVLNSELNHKALEAKFVNRMKLANFGPENVSRATKEIPFNFQPG